MSKVIENNPPRNLPFGRPLLGMEEREAVAKVLDGHILTHGPQCQEFEERFAECIGVKYAITTSSCTTALHLSLLALGVGPGDEVIVPAETHVATAHSVEHAGAKPVFVDVLPETGNINPMQIEAAISSKTKAVMVVHYLGLPCDMNRIMTIAQRHQIAIVEDCATALGAEYSGQAPGSFGVTGCFSFYPAKHITTMEGGMIVTDDKAIADRVRKQRAFGYDKGLGDRKVPGVYDIVDLGYNYRMSEAQAAIGKIQLERLPQFIKTRQNNAETLISRLKEIEQISFLPIQTKESRSGYYCINVLLEKNSHLVRAEVIANLNVAGVGTSVHYPVALPLSNYYQKRYGYREEDFPISNWISNNAISLPVGPHLGDADMHYIADQLKLAVQ